MKDLIIKNKFYRYLENKFGQWLETLGYAETTVYESPSYLREFLHFLEQNKCNHIKDITNRLIERYFVYLSERKNQRRSGSLSQNYLRNHLRTLRWFSKYLRETTGKSFEIGIHIQKPEITKKIILTKEEIKALYRAIVETPLGYRDRAMLDIYYGCGLRRNEGVNLDVKDVIFGKDLVYVRKGKNYKERYVPMSDKVKEDLKYYIKKVRPFLLGKETGNNALLLSVRGKRISGNSLYDRLQTLKKEAKITKSIGLHTLRHSIATHLLQDGMKLEQIATFLGHGSLENTQIYTHLSAETE
jgi:integrase/recombinase XerD